LDTKFNDVNQAALAQDVVLQNRKREQLNLGTGRAP
jgi:hypothetical protein